MRTCAKEVPCCTKCGIYVVRNINTTLYIVIQQSEYNLHKLDIKFELHKNYPGGGAKAVELPPPSSRAQPADIPRKSRHAPCRRPLAVLSGVRGLRQLREKLLDLLRVACRVGRETATETIDRRTEVMQLDIVYDHESIMEVVGV